MKDVDVTSLQSSDNAVESPRRVACFGLGGRSWMSSGVVD